MNRLPRLALVLALTALAAACAPRLQPAGPPIAEPRMTRTAFIAADGALLPLRRWMPDGKARAVFLALHGFNDYSAAFDAPASYWAAEGIATYALDQRGFGDAPHRGIWAGAPTMKDDVAAMARLLRSAHPGVPLYLVGDSMGGAVAMVTLAEAAATAAPIADGAVLVAPAVWGRRHMGAVTRGVLWLASHILPWGTVTGHGLAIEPSDNIPMLRRLGRDPKVIKETRIDAIKGLVDLMDEAFAAAPRLRGPVLLLYGGRDQIIPKKPSLETIAAMRANKSARTAIYDKAYHMLLRDLSAETAWKDIAAWSENPKAPLPSGAETKAGP